MRLTATGRILPRILQRCRVGVSDLGGVANHIKASMVHLLKDQRDLFAEGTLIKFKLALGSQTGEEGVQALSIHSRGKRREILAVTLNFNIHIHKY